MDPVQELLQFIANAPTSFQAVDAAIDCLQGFIRLDEHETWQLEQGKNYLVTRNGSSVIAFRVPVGKPVGFQMVASHSDSPMFKLKEHAETEVQGKYIRLDTEGYGGMIMASWLDRPLSVAGRVIVRQGNRLESRLVDLKRDMALIPNVAIHMNRVYIPCQCGYGSSLGQHAGQRFTDARDRSMCRLQGRGDRRARPVPVQSYAWYSLGQRAGTVLGTQN